MAESNSFNSSNTICRYYLLSTCRHGDKCQFSHDVSSADSKKRVCRFFLKGDCRYGDECWFLHPPVKKDVNAILNSHEDEQIADTLQTTGNPIAPTAEQDTNNNIDVHTEPNSASHPPDWVYAPEFVPKVKPSYSDVVKVNSSFFQSEENELCIFFYDGICPYNGACPCIHGDLCELCQKYCLHPTNEKQRKCHTEYCERELEQNMKLSFAIQLSVNKTCGICMDVVMEKDLPEERLFGILENCNHVYCLSCIRKWRSVEISEQAAQLKETFVTRACPECRVSSHFITPSKYWVEEEEEKKQLIEDYKLNLSKKPCKYFKQGEGICPFGGSCFYMHARPDGTLVVLPLNATRRRQNQDGELEYMEQPHLWDYLKARD